MRWDVTGFAESPSLWAGFLPGNEAEEHIRSAVHCLAMYG